MKRLRSTLDDSSHTDQGHVILLKISMIFFYNILVLEGGLNIVGKSVGRFCP